VTLNEVQGSKTDLHGLETRRKCAVFCD